MKLYFSEGLLQTNTRIVILILLLLCAMTASCQEPRPAALPEQRPKIGLALGGGGARGNAHIGLLKVLEELRIPVDYIAGTSMGAIVGSFYAMGKTPDEILQISLSTNWNELFIDKPDRKSLLFRRKMDYSASFFNFEMGFKDKRFIVPKGLVIGQKLRLVLQDITLPVSNINNFKELPIPFCAVATDIETGERVVLDHGNLAEALNASMAIPGVFSPVEIEGRMLVDGGIVSNVPVLTALEMGADIVIAMDVSKQLGDRESVSSISGVSRQVIDIMMRKTVTQEVTFATLAINPDLKKFSGADFNQAEELMKLGEIESKKFATALSEYSLSETEYQDYKKKKREPAFVPGKIEFVNIANTARVDSRIITRCVQTRPGDIFNVSTLRQDLNKLYELGDYERVDFRLVNEGPKTGLLIFAKEKTWGPNLIRLGMNFFDDAEGNSYFNLLARFNMTRLNRLSGEWRTDLQYGRTRRIFSEFYQPLNFAEFGFIAPSVEFDNEIIDVYTDDSKTAEYDLRLVRAGIEIGTQIRNFGEIRGGITGGAAEACISVGSSDLPEYDIRTGAYHGQLTIDQIDYPNFPQNSVSLTVDFSRSDINLGAEETYYKLESRFIRHLTWKHHTFFFGYHGGSNLGSRLPDYDQFKAGGLFSFSGYKPEQLRGQLLAIGRTGYLYRMDVLPVGVSKGLFLGAWIEGGSTWEDIHDITASSIHFAGTLAIGLDLPIGPLYLAYGLSEDDNSSFYITLGYTF